MDADARDKWKKKIFELQGNVYAFDSTTIDLGRNLNGIKPFACFAPLREAFQG